MSVCGQNGQGEDDCAPEEMGASVRDLYKQKPASKVVRVLTVLAYLLSVSLAAILLSVYYVCVWKSPELPHMNDTELAAHMQAADNQPDNLTMPISTGGGGSTVIPESTQAPVVNNNYNSGETNISTNLDINKVLTLNATSLPETSLHDLRNETSYDVGLSNTTDNVT